MVNVLEDLFPGLRGAPYRVTSPATEDYNCIAWAAGVVDAWWWPFGDPRRTHWPADVPREETVEAFRAAFALLGYSVCDGAELELGYEKVAVFADPEGCPTHVARQLPTGLWTSKVGKLDDIEHALHDLEGVEYGSVVMVLKRPRANDSATPG
jgi:hypothetical protein